MKRKSLFLTLILLFILTACNGNTETPIDNTDPTTDPYTVIQEAMENVTVNATVEHMLLPTNYGNVTITWTSNIAGTLSEQGHILQGSSNEIVTLTALFTYQGKSLTKLYDTTILADTSINEEEYNQVLSVMNNLSFEATTLTSSISFFTVKDGVSISYSSDNTSCMDNVGVITRPSENEGNCTVNLTATFTKGATTMTKSYTFTIVSNTTTVVYTGIYSGVEGLSGSALENALYDVITDTFVGKTYGDARYILDETDQDPTNPNNVILVYLQVSRSGEWNCSSGCVWNREHVWPQSLLGVSASNGTVNAASDLHNLKPSDPNENGSRGSLPFGTTGGTYEPPNEVKGDIARIVFYVSVMYDLNLSNVGNITLFLEWNEQDPVDDFEMNRNDVIESYQSNRNPFIDHPEFAELIWG